MQVRLHSVLYWPDEDKCISKQIVKGRCLSSAETKLWHLVRTFFFGWNYLLSVVVNAVVLVLFVLMFCPLFWKSNKPEVVVLIEDTPPCLNTWCTVDIVWFSLASTAVITFVLASFVKGFDCVCSETLYYFWMQCTSVFFFSLFPFLLCNLMLQHVKLYIILITILSFLCVCVLGGRGGTLMVLHSDLFLFSFTQYSPCVIPVLLTLIVSKSKD